MGKTGKPTQPSITSEEIEQELRDKMQKIEFQFRSYPNDTISHAVQDRIVLTSVKLSEYLFSQNKKFHSSVEAIRDLHNTYLQGVKKYEALKEGIPAEVAEAYRGTFQNPDHATYRQFLSKRGYRQDELDRIYGGADSYRKNAERTEKLLDALNRGHELYTKYSGNRFDENTKNRFKHLLSHAIYINHYENPRKDGIDLYKKQFSDIEELSRAATHAQARQNQAAQRR